MAAKYILLWLESTLQSWGADSKFGRRDTLPFPTKSGVLGLLCCALGAGGEQKELLTRMAPLSQTVVSYTRVKQDSKRKKIKVDRESLLRDFHMVGAGYDLNDQWENLLIPKTSDGGKPVGAGTKLTYRYYLQDSRFSVVLEVHKREAEKFTEALKNPVWDLYLGRKNCVPTDFIYRGIFDTTDKALKKGKSIANKKSLTEDFRVVDGEHDGEIMSINDVPLQFGEVKKYRDRLVTVIQV